jgi:hypothetical protein
MIKKYSARHTNLSGRSSFGVCRVVDTKGVGLGLGFQGNSFTHEDKTRIGGQAFMRRLAIMYCDHKGSAMLT